MVNWVVDRAIAYSIANVRRSVMGARMVAVITGCGRRGGADAGEQQGWNENYGCRLAERIASQRSGQVYDGNGS